MTAPSMLSPVTDDKDTGGFFEAAGRGELVVRACSQCGVFLHVPRAYCRACGSWAGEWRVVGGTGTLHSWTVADHQVHPAYPVPYTIVLVDLDDAPGVRLLGHLAGSPDLRADMPMQVSFEDRGDGVVLPNWAPASTTN
jgi:uncharacterized OB-fold protein